MDEHLECPSSQVEFPTLADKRAARRRQRDLDVRFGLVHARLRHAIDGTAAHAPNHGAPPSWDAIAALADECLDRLAAAPDPRSVDSLRLCDLIQELYAVGFEVCHEEVEHLERRLGDCATSLRRLHNLPSSADLIAHACQELVTKCGFGRAGLSRLESGYWLPWRCQSTEGPGHLEPWFLDFVDQPIEIEEFTPEYTAISTREPVVVHDTEATPVHRPITIEGGRAISYVVAPILSGDDVVGLLHADHHPTARRASSIDGHVLGAFADGFGQLLDGATLVERLREQRDLIWRILSATASEMDALSDAGVDLAPWTVTGSARALAMTTTNPISKLTAREAEVFELMVAGETNGTIAEKLVISEDTVKSHVKHILRKLGVANRAQAIASSLGGLGYRVRLDTGEET